MSENLQYDLFVSYKSENAAVARAVAEELMAAGVRVWFAEYEVLLSNYAQFQPAIDAGIDAARFALLFTNDLWAASPYCLLEIARIAQRLPPERIIQVCIPKSAGPQQVAPVLADVPTLEYGGSITDVVDFVWTRLGHEGEPLHGSVGFIGPGSSRIMLEDGVSLAPGELKQTLMAPGDRFTVQPGTRYHFEGEVFGHEVHVLLSVNTKETALTRGRPDLETLHGDDRAVYAANRRIALDQLQRMGVEQHGLHLVPWNGRNHFAITYGPWSYPDGRSAWERLYVLQLHSPHAATVGEMTVSCFITQEGRHGPMTFTNFCFLVGYFEGLIGELRYEPEKSGTATPQELAPSLTAGAFAQRTNDPAHASTFLVPPPVGWLQRLDMLRPIFPPPPVALCNREDLTELRQEFGFHDLLGWFFCISYAIVTLVAWYFSYPAPPATEAGDQFTLMFSRDLWALIGILLGVAAGPVLAYLNLSLYLFGRGGRYLDYVNRRVGYDARRAMLFAGAGYLFIAMCLLLYLPAGYAHIDPSGVRLYRFGLPMQYPAGQVQRILHVKGRRYGGVLLDEPAYVLEFNDGVLWSTRDGLRVPDADLEGRAMQFLAQRTGKPIEEHEAIEDVIPKP